MLGISWVELVGSASHNHPVFLGSRDRVYFSSVELYADGFPETGTLALSGNRLTNGQRGPLIFLSRNTVEFMMNGGGRKRAVDRVELLIARGATP